MNKHQQGLYMPKTFQHKLIIYNMFIVVCIALAVSFYSYRNYRSDMIDKAGTTSFNQITALSERLEIAYDEMVNILVNCAERQTLFTSGSYNKYSKYANPSNALLAANTLRDFCALSGYNNYIHKITVYDNDNFVLQGGTSYGSAMDPQNIMDAPWFYEYLTQETSQYSLKLVDTPFTMNVASTPKLLPMLRPLKYTTSANVEDSWVFLAISPKLYEDALDNTPGRHIYAVTRDGDLISSKDQESLAIDTVISQLLESPETSGNFQQNLDGRPCIITFQKQLYSGLLLFEVLPFSEVSFNHDVFGPTVLLVFLFCIGIGLSLSLLFSRQLAAPIKSLNHRLELISEGDFSHDDAIESNDEIGAIGRQINSMSAHISKLLDSRIQDEKEKKDLEIKMLQAQINPHFLYNTLDSIKWIATMQKNSGIVQLVTALSSLLKNMAKGFNEKVTLRQELDFLDNYVIIEKVRYIELFDLEIQVDDPALYDARIIKLTLQPIVENAIFSGIEPSGRFGLIQIHVFTENQTLYITVSDNGIGIPPEKVADILSDTSFVTKSNMSGIGLPNVDRRLKLVYGEHYGIFVESELDAYTKITISLPLEY